MSKTKSDTKGAAAKVSKKATTSVKEGRITKPAQTPKAKSKEIAKSAASKVEKKSKKSKKEPTPEPESSDSESEADSDSDSSDSSSDEEVEAKPAAKPAAVKKAESSDSSDSDSDSEDSSDSDSGSEEEVAPKTNGASKPAAKVSSDSDSSDSDSESESDEEEAPAKKAEATSDSDSDSDDSESDSDASDSSEEEAPSKKRKAEDEAEPIIKKAKTEEVADEGVKNLFVGNLSWSIDEDWLAREFESFGEITGCRIITDRETQRPKGFGYVEYSTADAAAKAKAEMHGKEVDGRALNVDFSTPRQNNPKEKVGARAARFGDKPSVPSNTLFIGNLSFDSTNDSIHEAFSAYGEISRVSLPTDRDTGNPKGFGYVDFGSVDEAKAALEALNGYEVDGRPIRVDYATPREDNGGGGGRGGRGGFGDRGGRGGGRGGRGGGRGGRGGFGDRGGRGGARGGRGGFSTNRGGFGDFQGKKVAF